MKLTILYSIFNRTKLFERGLLTVLAQTMPKEDFEIIVVDDNSTEDIMAVLKPYIGQLNIRYIKYDHTKHPIWHELNPDGIENTWYHTQAISANIGISKAQGDILCISQPEMLHNPESFVLGHSRASQNKAIFGEIIMSSQQFNQWLDDNSNWAKLSYNELVKNVMAFGTEYQYSHMPDRQFYEMYWHVMYFPTDIARQVNGVDLQYQKGVYAEDDQFKMRVRMAGCPDTWGGRPNCQGDTLGSIVGIHQSHMDEGGKIKRQDRGSLQWNQGSEHNRSMFRDFCLNPFTVANEGIDPWGQDLIVEDNYYGI